MDDFYLHRMNTPHALKAHGTRSLTPVQQPFGVGHVTVHRIDGLHTRGVDGVDHTLAGIERLASARSLGYAEIGGVVLQPDSDGGNALRRRRDGEGILDP